MMKQTSRNKVTRPSFSSLQLVYLLGRSATPGSHRRKHDGENCRRVYINIIKITISFHLVDFCTVLQTHVFLPVVNQDWRHHQGDAEKLLLIFCLSIMLRTREKQRKYLSNFYFSFVFFFFFYRLNKYTVQRLNI